MRKKGIFITFEGGEGVGKTTQIKKLKNKLEATSPWVTLTTREPGGTPIGEKIRALLIDPRNQMNHITESYLYAAARAEHMNELILPALEAGNMVLCDRFLDSSLVYQGIARGLGMETIFEINHQAVSIMPDLTFLLDLDPREGFHRKEQNNFSLDRMEQENFTFHEKVRDGYRTLAEKYDRIVLLNGHEPEDLIHEKIYTKTMEFLQQPTRAF